MGQPCAPASSNQQIQQSPTGTTDQNGANQGVVRQNAERALAQETAPLSPLEKALGEGELVELGRPQPYMVKPIRQFGYSFFVPGAPGFAPLFDVPVSSDYVIGPGDKIILNAWGSIDGIFELEVNRSGEIVLPKVGSVKVWGTPFAKLTDMVKGALGKYFKDFHVNVTMGKLRLIKVYVVGEVQSPGDYNVSALSTVISVLSAAGGPTRNGSLRSIQVRRGDKIVETVDLYDFFLTGDKSKDIRLLSGDTIFVPVIGKVVGVAGNVKRPAIFELKNEASAKDLLDLAGGVISTSYLHRVQIARVVAHDKMIVSDFNLDPGQGKTLEELTASVKIQDLDRIKVFPIDGSLKSFVRLEGYVLRPGDYALKQGMRVTDLIGRDNLLPEHYTEVGEITRLVPPDFHPEKIYFNLGKALSGDLQQNLPLQEFDVVKLFNRYEMEEVPVVSIRGEILKPGVYRLTRNLTIRDLVLQAGNIKRTAYLQHAEITRISSSKGKVTSFPILINLEEALKGDAASNILLEPFDEVQIRRIPNWAEETDRYVQLKGEVEFPGIYPIFKGEKLSSVIERAGGYSENAYLKGAKFTRKQVQELQQKRMEEVLARTDKEIALKQQELASSAVSKEEIAATTAALESLKKTMERLKGIKTEGRVSLKLAPLDVLRNSPYDLELMGGDVLEIPLSPMVVNVFGEVYNPTTLVHLGGKPISYYLRSAGGPTSNAEDGEIYVIKADGSVVSRQESSMGFSWDDNTKSWSFGGFLSATLDPGDTIVVPQKLDRIAWVKEIKDWTSILANIAMSAGVLIAAGL